MGTLSTSPANRGSGLVADAGDPAKFATEVLSVVMLIACTLPTRDLARLFDLSGVGRVHLGQLQPQDARRPRVWMRYRDWPLGGV